MPMSRFLTNAIVASLAVATPALLVAFVVFDQARSTLPNQADGHGAVAAVFLALFAVSVVASVAATVGLRKRISLGTAVTAWVAIIPCALLLLYFFFSLLRSLYSLQ